MARIKQIGVGRKTSGTIDGITYVTRKGVTYARSAPTMPASAYKTPAARKRQAIFKLIQMHLRYHLRTLRQTISPSVTGSATNRYYSLNSKGLAAALSTLADQYIAGEIVTINDVETAISAYATEHPNTIRIAALSGYQDVYLTGAWPDTITLNALVGDNTVIIIVSENGSTTTINPDGTSVVVTGSSDSGGTSNGSTSGFESGGTGTTPALAAPLISGDTPFEETTTVTISGPDEATVYYTLDGSTPTDASSPYSEPFTLTSTTTVKAVAVKNGISSSVASMTFTQGTATGDDLGE